MVVLIHQTENKVQDEVLFSSTRRVRPGLLGNIDTSSRLFRIEDRQPLKEITVDLIGSLNLDSFLIFDTDLPKEIDRRSVLIKRKVKRPGHHKTILLKV